MDHSLSSIIRRGFLVKVSDVKLFFLELFRPFVFRREQTVLSRMLYINSHRKIVQYEMHLVNVQRECVEFESTVKITVVGDMWKQRGEQRTAEFVDDRYRLHRIV